MKKVLFAAVAAVITLVACQNNNQAGTTATGSGTTAGTQETVKTMPSIAYINIDSLIINYDRAIDMQKVFEEKYKKAETQLQTKMQRLEKDMLDYQDKAQKGLMTRSQMAETEEKLGRQQQVLMQDRDKLLGELSEEEQVMNNTIFYAVSDFLDIHNADYKYSMIISTTATGPILHADPSLNITSEVLRILNEQYAAEKAAKK